MIQFVAAAALPVLVCGLVVRGLVAEQITQEVNLHNRLKAEALAEQAQIQLEKPLIALESAASFLVQAPKGEVDADLTRFVRRLETFESIYLLDERGHVAHLGLAEQLEDHREDFVGLDLSRQPAYERARATRRAAWSGAFNSVITGRLSMSLAVPVGDVVLVGTFGLDSMSKLGGQVLGPHAAHAIILDEKGTVLFLSDPAEVQTRLNLSSLSPVRRGLSGEHASVRYSAGGEARVGTLTQIPHSNWRVLVSSSEAETYAPVRRIEAIVLGGTLAGVVLALLASALLGSRLTLPLRQFGESAREVAEGRFPASLPVQRHEELEALAVSFRSMAKAIADREESLRTSEARFRTTFEQAALGLAHADAEGRFVWVNERLCEIFGLREEELYERTLFEVTHPDDVSASRGRLEEVRSGELDSFSLEKRVVRRDGEALWIRVSVCALNDTSGTAVCVGVVEDISARKKAEEESLRLEGLLRQAEKLEAIGQLAGGIAHDFNNILAVVLGAAELMTLGEPSQEAIVGFVDDMQTVALRGADLTSQLLDFSRRGKGRSVPVAMHALAEEVVKLLGRSIDPSIKILSDLRGEKARVLGDPTQLQNALLNLGVNARDAMPTGGTLTFRVEPRVWTEGDSPLGGQQLPPGDYVEVAVTDTGTGIPSDVVERIFEPFFTTKELGRGTGMGLAAVYGCVQSHGGAVGLTTREGEGTTFTLLIPRLVEALATEPAVPVLENSPAQGQGHVLLVDDNEVLLKNTKLGLERLGYSVTACADGIQAETVYRERRDEIDLVCLDMRMPDRSGPETLRALKAINDEVRVVIASGFADAKSKEECSLLGAVAFLDKPYSLTQLAQVLNEYLVAAS